MKSAACKLVLRDRAWLTLHFEDKGVARGFEKDESTLFFEIIPSECRRVASARFCVRRPTGGALWFRGGAAWTENLAGSGRVSLCQRAAPPRSGTCDGSTKPEQSQKQQKEGGGEARLCRQTGQSGLAARGLVLFNQLNPLEPVLNPQTAVSPADIPVLLQTH